MYEQGGRGLRRGFHSRQSFPNLTSEALLSFVIVLMGTWGLSLLSM